MLSYHGGSGVFMGLLERRGTLCWRRCSVFELQPIILLVVVVPPFANTGCSKPGDKKDGAFDKLPFDILKANEEREAVPSDFWGGYRFAL